MDEILSTIVHEGRHFLDITSGVIPAKNGGGILSLFAELRAWTYAGEFAGLNGLIGAKAYRYSGCTALRDVYRLADELNNTPLYQRQFFGRMTDDQIDEAIRLFLQQQGV